MTTADHSKEINSVATILNTRHGYQGKGTTVMLQKKKQ
jgi:hypothetical protein